MGSGGSARHLLAQQVTTKATPMRDFDAGSKEGLPEEPGVERYPAARVVEDGEEGTLVTIDSTGPQSYAGGKFVVDGNVVLKYRDRTVRADHVEYEKETGELTATGHLLLTGGPNQERIAASHGTMNLKTQTGRFYDVSGSVGLKTAGSKTLYVSDNPFLFSGRLVVKTGPRSYDVYDGTVTSCQLPHPDWLLSAAHFNVDENKARAQNSVFRLLNVPLLYLPYVTHSVDSETRQSGLMLPVFEVGSSVKGTVVGEEFYVVFNRSTEMTLGVDYFSMRGWYEVGSFRYRGLGDDFVTLRANGLADRGYTPVGGTYTDQSGEDISLAARRDFSATTRVVLDAEYLSSYVYRQAFDENFNTAVSSDIISSAYGVRESDGISAAVRADRYQGLKRVAVPATGTAPATPEQEVHIFHAPSLDLSATDHALGTTGLLWSLESSAAGLKRTQPGFATSGIIERLDLHPQIAYPLKLDGWKLVPSLAARETLYSRSRIPGVSGTPTPIENTAAANRADLELRLDMRAPVVERTFEGGWLARRLDGAVKHTIEPEFTYRYVSGIGNFQNLLRFDTVDVVSDTNELEYGVTQRLFVRPNRTRACTTSEVSQRPGLNPEVPPMESAGCGSEELISWRLTQKYFFDPAFGGAVISGRRNIFDTTLNLSGVAFLTEPRDISPLVSRLRVRTSANTDVEWDFDLDTGAKKFTSNNIFLDLHQGNGFGALSFARLDAPGRFYTEGISSRVSDFTQMRVLVGYGVPTKPGLSVAGNAGFDLNLASLQYGALQASYNWNCCGLSLEYRKYELGAVRNEGTYRFNFTLVNVGTAGNLRRAQRLF